MLFQLYPTRPLLFRCGLASRALPIHVIPVIWSRIDTDSDFIFNWIHEQRFCWNSSWKFGRYTVIFISFFCLFYCSCLNVLYIVDVNVFVLFIALLWLLHFFFDLLIFTIYYFALMFYRVFQLHFITLSLNRGTCQSTRQEAILPNGEIARLLCLHSWTVSLQSWLVFSRTL